MGTFGIGDLLLHLPLSGSSFHKVVHVSSSFTCTSYQLFSFEGLEVRAWTEGNIMNEEALSIPDMLCRFGQLTESKS